MTLCFFLLILPCFWTSTRGWKAPVYDGFECIWQEDFTGPQGTLPNPLSWKIMDGDLKVNNESQVYRKDPRNVQLSGGGTLQLVPWRDSQADKGWTSGRIESLVPLKHPAGTLARVESALRFGNHPAVNKRGLWPAFWMLGESIRDDTNTSWPLCGEIDIMETVNGELVGHGSLHFDENRPHLTSSVDIPDSGWHTWRMEIDRRPGNFLDQSIGWYLDGVEFSRVYGAVIADESAWRRVAHSPLFTILNLAVGGDWPGYPDDYTLEGYGSMVEYGYVAYYQSAQKRD